MRPEEELGRLLVEKGKTLAVAESCTGGLVSDMITNVQGSSRYFLAGLVAYGNEVKVSLLGVNRSTLDMDGAVSEEAAREMAKGVRQLIGSDIGAGITGIAGPGGGTSEKPVGLVYFAVDNGKGIVLDRVVFQGGRQEVKRSSAEHLINMILSILR